MVVFDKNILEDPVEELENVSIPNPEREGPLVRLFNRLLKESKSQSYHNTNPKAGHWSSATGCKRRSYLNYVHKLDDNLEPLDNDINSEWTFTHGDLIHEFLQELILEEYGEEHVTIEERISEPISDEFEISGHADIVIRGLDDFPDPFVIDIKTKAEFTYYNPGKRGHVRSTPAEDNIMQLNGYMNHVGAKFGALLYYSKRNDHLEEYWIEYDDELFQEGIDEITTMLEYVRDGVPAPRDSKPYLCCDDYCPYYREGLCQGVDEVDEPENMQDVGDKFHYKEGQWD